MIGKLMARGFGTKKQDKEGGSKCITPQNVITIEDAISLMQNGNLPGAIATAEGLIAKNPNDARCYKILAGLELMNGNWLKAIAMSNAYLAFQPDDNDALYVIGVAHQELGDVQSAISSYKKILVTCPSSADTWNNLGVVMEQTGNLEEAVRCFRQGLKSSFNAADPFLIRLNLAQALEYSHQLDEAVQVYEESFGHLNSAWHEHCFTSLISSLPVLLQLGEIARAKELLGTAFAAQDKYQLKRKTWRNKTHDLDYLHFLSRLLPLVTTDDIAPALCESRRKHILHIGDSHCLTFANSTCVINGSSYIIEPRLIKGAKAWHFANQETNRYKQSLDLALNQDTPRYDLVFVSFGEIDCRVSEGINAASQKLGLDPIHVASQTATGYIKYIASRYDHIKNKLVVFGTPAFSLPRAGKIKDRSQLTRMLEIINTFNIGLANACDEKQIRFIDTYSLTLGPNGLNNQIWMLDKYHLSPSALHVLTQDLSR
jgi:tetratricopeptide (TPR) repeat protein